LEGNNLPPSLTISPKTSDRNFEIAILFTVIKRSGNYVFEDDDPPKTFRARVVSYVLEAFKVYIERMIA